jgi:hypothetical protein
MSRRDRPRVRLGFIKVYAHRLLAGEPIPIFRDNRVNRAINRFVAQIRAAITWRP